MSEKDKFKELVTELLSVPTEEREAEILEYLDSLSPDPEYLDYIYNSTDFCDSEGSVNVNAVAEKVFNYKSIQL